MPLWQVVVLAVVQGVTEFLPISSSAHLILIPHFLHWNDPGLAFDVALHLGTLIAVVVYFLRDWVELILCGFGVHYPQRATEQMVLQNRRIFWYLVVGTIPGGLVGFLFEHWIDENLRNPIPIAGAMILVALVMWYAEATSRLSRPMEEVSLADSVSIGSAQALALFPGVSRSGITITTGLFRGMTREAAARFSFLLSTPLIAGAAAKEVPKLLKLHKAGGLDMPASEVLIAIAVSAIVGFAVIAFLLRYLQTRTLKIFVYYRIIFGIVVLALAFLPLGSAR